MAIFMHEEKKWPFIDAGIVLRLRQMQVNTVKM